MFQFSQVTFQSKSKKSQENSTRNFAFEKDDKPPDLEPFKKHMISPGSFVEYHVAVFENEEELSKKLIKNLPVMDDDTTPGNYISHFITFTVFKTPFDVSCDASICRTNDRGQVTWKKSDRLQLRIFNPDLRNRVLTRRNAT